jgi:hypothetical protein
LGDQIKEDEMLRHWHVYGFWWGYIKERYQLEKSRYRWEDNINLDETGWERSWFHQAKDRDWW